MVSDPIRSEPPEPVGFEGNRGRFREAERCGEEEAGLVVAVDWWWVIGRRCDGDNVLLVPDETTWMDGRQDIIRARHAVGPTCSLLWREHAWKMV